MATAVLSSVFPRPNFTLPTPESTPNIGSVASPDLVAGAFSNNDVDASVIWNRAWSTVTRYLTLTPETQVERAAIKSTIAPAFDSILRSADGQTQLADWYYNEIVSHFRSFVLPYLQDWRREIPLSQADRVLEQTIGILRTAIQQYRARIDALGADLRDKDQRTRIEVFSSNVQRKYHALVQHSLPQRQVQNTLSYVFYSYLKGSLITTSDPGRCAEKGDCSCELDIVGLPLHELHEVGLGNSIGERAFAYALHQLLNGPAIERRCFQVDWVDRKSVVHRLKSWIERKVSPVVELAQEKLCGYAKPAGGHTDELVPIATNNLRILRTSALFDYVKAWPASTGAILDIWECLHTSVEKAHVCRNFSEQIETRLLHAGASTAEILSIYVNVIHTFKALDGRGVLLEKVAGPIRTYLRSRDDTVSIIAASFLAETDSEGNAVNIDGNRICPDIVMVVSSTTLGVHAEEESLRWDDMEWVPDPIDAGPHYQASKSEDVIAQILGLFDSEQFIKEITTELAQHLLHSTDANYVKETRLVELLKSRLDATKLQAAEVMLKDMRDSVALGKRINPSSQHGSSEGVPTPREIQAAIPAEGISTTALYGMFENRIKRPQFFAAVKLVANKRNDGLLYAKRTRRSSDSGEGSSKSKVTKFDAQILSSYFWPQLRSESFAMPDSLTHFQDAFEDKFEQMGSQRRLEWRPALTRATMRMEFEDRVVEETDVPGWRAAILDFYTSYEEYDDDMGLSVDFLADSLRMDEGLVRDATTFWTNKSVLYQLRSNVYAVRERLDMDIGTASQVTRGQTQDDMVSAVKSQDAALRENAAMFETFIANMLRNSGAKAVTGPMGITNLLKMVLPTFTYGDEEVRWLLGELERKGVVRQSEGGDSWSVVA